MTKVCLMQGSNVVAEVQVGEKIKVNAKSGNKYKLVQVNEDGSKQAIMNCV